MGKSYAEMMGASAHEASDALLPTQMFRSASTLRPEHRLMIAVLENAIESLDKDCRSRDERRLRACRQVEAWVRSGDTSSPFAFESICDALGLDADYVRTGLRRWRTRQRQMMPRVPTTPPAGAQRAGSAETPKASGQ